MLWPRRREKPPLILSSLAAILWALMMLVSMSLQSRHMLCWIPVLVPVSLIALTASTMLLSMLLARASLGREGTADSRTASLEVDLAEDLNECRSIPREKLDVKFKLLEDISGPSGLVS